MNFQLRNLETHISEFALTEGEFLLERQQISNLVELERHLWIANVGTEPTYEVEVKISPSKVLAATCDCDDFTREKMCPHVAALLLMLRKKRTELQQKKQQREKKKRSTKKLTTGLILDQIGSEDLKAFVKQYAKTNRNFAIALKARFASEISVIDSEEKYAQLLETTIKAARRPDRQISHRGSQKIEKVIEQLLGQAADQIALKQFSEAFIICRSILDKIPPIINKLTGGEEALMRSITKTFDNLNQILDRQPPAALRESIWNYGLEESGKAVYRKIQFDRVFFELLLRLADESDQFDQLLFLLDTQISHYQNQQVDHASFLLMKLNTLEKAGREEATQELIENNLNRQEVLLFAINHAYDHQHYARVKTLATAGLKTSRLRAMHQDLEEMLFQVARREGDKKKLYEFGLKRLLSTSQESYFLQLKEALDSQASWPRRLKKILNALDELPDTIPRRQLKAAIFATEELESELIDLIRNTRSLEILHQHSGQLSANHKKQIAQLYQDLLQSYLSNHLGRKPSQKIRILISQLHQQGAHDLATSLVEDFRRQFPERHSLMEELEIF